MWPLHPFAPSGINLTWRIVSVLFPVALLLGSAAGAQTPSVSLLDYPPGDQSFVGEQFCFNADFSNTGAPGFGPYYRLILEPGLTLDSATTFGVGSTIKNEGIFPAAPGNQLDDSITGEVVTGPDGYTLYTIVLPVGSLVDGGPPVLTQFCLTIDSSVTPFVPLDITFGPGYIFGDTPTGDNGPINGASVDRPITPTIVRFEKDAALPEDEVVPGWPYDYSLVVDIANGVTIYDLDIQDLLPAPAQLIFIGPVTVSGGTGCVASYTEPTISVTCTSATGGSGESDLVIDYTVEVADILDETACDLDTVTNAASLTARYEDPATPGSRIDLPSPLLDVDAVEVKHVQVQKGPDQSANPGAAVSWTVNFQVTDYDDLTGLVFDDTLPDGVGNFSNGTLTIGGSTVAITPSVSPQGDGTIDLQWDIGAALGADVPASTSISLTYSAEVLQTYLSTGEPVLTRDTLVNVAGITFSTEDGASGCSDGTSATITVTDTVPTKTIKNPQALYQPGDVVTYVLGLDIPSGDVQNVQFVDFFPLPVYDVTTVNLTFGVDTRLGPGDTLGLVPTAITASAATNSIEVDWPDVDTTGSNRIELEIDIVINDIPFADGLILQNLFQVTDDNTGLDQDTEVQPFPITIRAPNLSLTKGASAGAPGAAQPFDGNVSGVDAGDTITYTTTIENIGGAEAYDVTITDTPPAGLTACALVSVVDGNGAAITVASGDLFATPLVLSNDQLGAGAGALQANDDSPAGGGSPYDDDTAIVSATCQLDGSVEPGQILTNTASVTWASAAGQTAFPADSDTANVTVAAPAIDKTRLDTSPDPDGNDATVNIGEIVTYRVEVVIPEGTIQDADLFDQLDAGLAFVPGSVTVVLLSNGLPTTDIVPANAPALVTISDVNAAAQNQDRRLLVGFGTIINNNRDDGAVEILRLEYQAVVINWSNNNRGDQRNNRADFRWDPPGSGTSASIRDVAPNVRIEEPTLELTKSFTPTTAVGGETVQVTLVLAHTPQSNSDAYDVVLEDVLPAELVNPTNFSTTACATAPTTPPGAVGSTVSAGWSTLPVGQSCTITFDVDVTPAIPAGAVITNQASAQWSSLAGPWPPVNPANPLTGERTGDPSDPGGGANTYNETAPADLSIRDVGISKSIVTSSETATGATQGDGAVTDLAVGEVVTFGLIVTLPASTTANPLIVRDSLPFSPGVLDAVAVRITDQGPNVTPAGLASSATVTLLDNALADGYEDFIEIGFGSVTNADVASDQTITIEIDAVVVDDAIRNTSITSMTNSALVQFNSSLSGSSTASVEVVEPKLNILKEGDVTVADAGDPVVFTLTVEHLGASSADAFDVVLDDVIVPSRFSVIAGPALGACSTAPDSGPTLSGGSITASWDQLPLGESCQITYTAQLTGPFQPGETLPNTATLDWTSVDNDPQGEARDGTDQSTWNVTVSAPGVDKTIVSTSVTETEADQKGTAEDLTIGETVTFQMVVSLPDATLLNADFTDQLPTSGAILEVVSSTVVSVGSDITTLITPGQAGVASDSNGDSYDDRVSWDLGDLINAADALPDPNPADQIVFEVIAVVKDVATNEGSPGTDVNLLNTGRLTSATVDVSGSVPFDIVAPELRITKTPLPTDPLLVAAGATVGYRITIEHTPDSTASAFNVSLSDSMLGANASYVDLSATSDCPGFSETSGVEPPLEIALAELPLSVASCTIDYTVTLAGGLPSTGSFVNTAGLDWESAPGSSDSRPTMVADTGTLNSAATFQLEKSIVATSLSDTSDSQHDPMVVDATIGETVTYQISVTLDEGGSTGVVISDTVDAGLEIVGARIVSVGGQIIAGGTTLPGTPVFAAGAGNTVSFDFGNVTNLADGVDNGEDQILVEVLARVLNVAGNVGDDPAGASPAPTVLQNGAALTANSSQQASDQESIEVVEPRLDLTKSMTMVNGAARVKLTATNTGTAPAYDVELIDLFDETKFVASSAVPFSLPAGFTLSQVSGGGNTTVTISTGSPATPSVDQVIDLGEVVSFVFDVGVRSDLTVASLPLTNDARAEGTTLPGPSSDERVGDDGTAEDDINDTATATLAVPILDVDKTATPSPASAGQTITYSIRVENVGTATANGIVVSDTPPPGGCAGNPTCVVLVNGSVTAAGGAVVTGNTPGETTIAAQFASLAPSGVVTVTYQVMVPDPLAVGVTAYSNQASVDSDELDPVLSDDPGTGTPDDPTITPISGAPDLSIDKDDGGASVAPGGTVTYTLIYDNVGSQDATGVVITETVPLNSSFTAGSSSAGWSCLPDSSAGSTCTIAIGAVAVADPAGSVDFAVTAVTPFPVGLTQLSNSASIADDGNNGPDPDSGNDSDPDTTPIVLSPALEATKTDALLIDGDASGTVSPGDTLRYTVVVTSVGDVGAENIVFTDTPGANTSLVVGSVTTTLGAATTGNTGGDTSVAVSAAGPLLVSSSMTVTFDVTIDDPVDPPTTVNLINQGSVTATGAPNEPTDDSDTPTDDDPTVTPVVLTPALEVTKSDTLVVDADSDGLTPDDTLEYTVVVASVGNTAAQNVVFFDTPDPNTTLVVGSVTTDQGTVVLGNSAGNTSLEIDAGLIPVGSFVTITFRVTLNDPVIPPTTTSVSNQGLVTGTDIPGEPSDDPDTPGDDDPTVTPFGLTPVLEASKAGALLTDAAPVGLGAADTVRYTVIIVNSGSADATAVAFDDSLAGLGAALQAGSVTTSQGTVLVGNTGGDSTVSIDIGTMAPAAVVTVTFDVVVDDPATVTELVNQGTVSSTELPSEPTDDPDTPADDDPTVLPLDGQVLLDATKTDFVLIDANGDGGASPGDTLRYVVVLENSGSETALNVQFTDTPDPNTTLINGSVTTDQGTVTLGNGGGEGSLAVSVGDVLGGSTVTISFDVLITSPLPPGVSQLDNQGTFTADNHPNVPTDDPDTATPDDPTTTDDPTLTPLGSMPELEATKADALTTDADMSSSVSAGDTLTYTVVITALGDAGSTNVVFNDAPDPNTSLVVGSVTTSQGTVTLGNSAGNSTVSVAIGSMAVNDSVTVTFQVLIDNPLPTGLLQISNQGLVSGDGVPGEPTDDPDDPTEDDPTVTPLDPGVGGAVPILEVTKVDVPGVDGVVSGGDTLPYVIVIRNLGLADATGVVFSDTPGTGSSLIAGTVTTTQGTVTTGNAGGDTSIVVDVGIVPQGGTVTLGFDVLIDSPPGVRQIDNQGVVDSNETDPEPSDDPDDPVEDDPTTTPIGGVVVLDSTKRDDLLNDADGDGRVSPGDTLRYVIEITNGGDTAATNVMLMDTPDANTQLLVGSVTTDTGVVTLGNSAGDTAVGVNIGVIPAFGSSSITFDVVISLPLPAGVTELVNQGTVDYRDETGTDQQTPTDDPDTGTQDDPTVTPLTLDPEITASKSVTLLTDTDLTGYVTAGDFLRYTVVISSVGNVGVSNVTFVDTPDLNTILVVGSVSSSPYGVVVFGNTAGDTAINIDLGSVEVGDVVTIVYDVEVANPLVDASQLDISNQGLVTSDENEPVVTDDPGTGDPDDPTVIPVITDLYAIPTVADFGLLLLSLLLCGTGIHQLRRRQEKYFE